MLLRSAITDSIHKMVREQLLGRDIRDKAVLAALMAVPRHRFVSDVLSEESIHLAYSDSPVPTVDGQTISQPYMVALMTESLRVERNMNVLEIGTGSGYQTAILGYLGANIVSVEHNTTLIRRARSVLIDLGYANQTRIIHSDGTLGYPPSAPYDRILVTAAAPRLPEAYREQLRDPGRIVIPIGNRVQQNLITIDLRQGIWTEHTGIPCRFVPLIGRDGWDREDVL